MYYPINKMEYETYVDRYTRLLGEPDYYSSPTYGKGYSWNHCNLKVKVTEHRIKLMGSIHKYHQGYNYKPFTLSDMWGAVLRLSDELKLELMSFNVTRIDIAANLITDYEPQVYYPLLGESSPYKRLLEPNSIIYKLGIREKSFYDKVDEGRNNSVALPIELQDKNILRFEVRYKKDLLRQFNRPKLILSNLFNEEFYFNLVTLWGREYQAISKIGNMGINLENIKSKRDLRKAIMSTGMLAIGQDKLIKLVSELKARKALKHSADYSHLKAEIINGTSNTNILKESPLLTELNTKVNKILFETKRALKNKKKV